MKTVTKEEIKKSLAEVGLKAGDNVMVHTSLSKIGYVCGGAQTGLPKQKIKKEKVMNEFKHLSPSLSSFPRHKV
ncbi:hypothetical protein [Butyrivibrio sp. AE3006]|uniref:hypothetical protein n=1 Tax=Butyrivibrio sp. AE3006 TaxID=1280673 RepID=UPI0003F54C37|nr:hypothetical protein [Butyrivibrio sp. AE3006]